MQRDIVYMDNAATTRVDENVVAEMLPFFSKKYGNASSLHSLGNEAREALEEARARVAKAMNAEQDEVVFTSGGTESDNLAIVGVARKKEKGHIITSSIEHPAVLNTCQFLEKKGFSVTYAPVNKEGIIEVEAISQNIRPDTFLITIMHANNEIGTIQPIREIAKIAKEREILIHTDAVQSFGKIDIDINKLGVDLLSLSSHKIHGPKGVGALFVRKGTPVSPLVMGGGHERGLRSGTENVAGVVGLGAAAKIAKENMKENEKIGKLRDKLIDGILKIDDSRLNGAKEPRLPNNVNVSFRFIEGESLVLLLDEEGVCASTASACSSKSLKPSHVLLALGLPPEDAHGSLRLTLSKYNTKADIKKVLDVLPRAIESLRSISPFKSNSELRKFSEKYSVIEEEDDDDYRH